MKLAAIAIILLAIFNANNASALLGSNITLENAGSAVGNLARGFWCTVSWCGNNGFGDGTAQAAGTVVNNPTIEITASGYNPNNLAIKAGSTITLHLKNTGGVGCTQAFTIPSLGVQKVVPTGQSDTLTFTAPSQPGTLPFMCSMGMYRGQFQII